MPSITFRPSSTDRRSRRALRLVPGIAIVGVLAVVGSLTATPASAHASEVSLQAAQAAVSASVNRGTYEQDVTSGRITAEELTDVTLAAMTARGVTLPTGTPSRAELIRRTDVQIAELRAHGPSDSSSVTLASPTGAPTATNPLATSDSFWSHFKHWFTFSVNNVALAAAGISGGVALGFIVGACLSSGVYSCAAVAAISAAALAALSTKSAVCLADHQDTLYVKVPDFGNSHC